MEYSLTDLVDMSKLKSVLESLHDTTGIQATITDLKGNILVINSWTRICSVFHRTTPESLKRCIKSDTFLSKQLDKHTGYAKYKCLNGMTDMAVPIVVDGKHLANLFTGQFFQEPPDLAFFSNQAEQFDWDKEDYLSAVAEVPIYSSEQTEKNIIFLQGFANLIGEMGLNNKKLLALNEELEARVRTRTTQLEEEIVKRKNAQEKLLQAERLQGVLEMAATTAHRFSQPLQVLHADLTFIEDALESKDPDVLDAMASVKEAASDLSSLVKMAQNITQYTTEEYSESQRILNLEKSSSSD